MFLKNCSEYFILTLIPLAVWSIVVNILLYFPNGDTTYAANSQLTNYVWYFQGICFGGIMPEMWQEVEKFKGAEYFHKALYYHCIGIIILSIILLLVDFYKCSSSCCCGNQVYHIHCSRLGSALFALLGVLFSGYSLIISSLGLSQGPYCRTDTGWSYHFANTAGGYLVDSSSWSQCLEPANVVEWNIILFSILIALSALQVIICFCKAIHDVIILFCGTHKILDQPDTI